MKGSSDENIIGVKVNTTTSPDHNINVLLRDYSLVPS